MLKKLNGVGSKTLYHLNDNDIYTIDDLLLCFPKEYIVYKHSPEKLFENVDCYIEGYVDSNVSIFKYRGNSFAFSFYLKFDNYRIKMSIFSNIYVGTKIKKGSYIGVYGRLHPTKHNFNIKKLFIDDLGFKIETNYKIKDILDSKMSKIIASAINTNHNIKETLPETLLKKYKLPSIDEYIYKSHFPKSVDDINEVIRRRKYEEFYWYSLSLAYIRHKRIDVIKKERNIDINILDSFINTLNYELTVDQKKAIDDIVNDLNLNYPMNRLIEGDVGCGKTIVGIIASLLIAKSGFQVACLAPTGVLALQEYNEYKKYLSKYDLDIELLTSSVSNSESNDIVDRLIDNKIDIIVGTHSLLYDRVKFSNLGLVIIDEQHRFGVKQRLKLINKYENVDSLFFSATPIPRTLGLTFLNDLNISSIKSMPKGRKEIVTKILSFDKMNSLIKSIENHLLLGEKAYIVVPLISDDNELGIMDIYSCNEYFVNKLPNYNIGILHGKLKQEEKEDVISKFKKGEINVLISTTVVEVGVDIKDATMMIILNAERFGLSTLHQLRGRVGRGNLESYCILVSDDIDNPRLNALKDLHDGFEIAEMDFKLRGPGNYLGDEQSGYQNLIYASFTEDLKILKCAKQDSEKMIVKYLNGSIDDTPLKKMLSVHSELDKIN